MARYLAYLAHPYGRNEKNREDSIKIQHGIEAMMDNDEIEILNPLTDEKVARIAQDYYNDEEMIIAYCGGVASACHLIIFCPGWEDSVGCRHEHEMALKYNVPRIYLSRFEADIFREANLLKEIEKQQKAIAREEAVA